MSRPARARSFAAVGVTVALLVGSLAVAPPVVASPAPSSGKSGPWTVLSGRDGTTVLWRGAGALPTGDARPSFALDGRPLAGTPLGGVGGRPYQLVLPGRYGVRADALSVTLGAGAPAARPRRSFASRANSLPARPSVLVSPDPGAAGPYRTTTYTYLQPSLDIGGLPVPVEVEGRVVAPVGAIGRRPVVMFLHGRHATCFRDKEVTGDWPCLPGYKAIPSLNGYRYLQQLLASRGYVTVSIAANGINGQDGGLMDGGAHARSVLIRHHLALLARWSRASGPRVPASLKGHVDLRHILLVGHSRGGEGVARATIDATDADPYRLVGQVLIAPTDFGREVAVGIPTTVLLPYCDGDVSDLQGQQYVDQSRGLVTGDHALVTSALVLGANHNFFNSEWTPGLAAAPANDDWTADADQVCGSAAPGRLTSAGQRAVGAAYVAAAAASYLTHSPTAVRLLDGSKVRAASAGSATVLTEALGGARTGVLADPSRAVVRTTRGVTAVVCPGFTPDGTGQCLTDGSGLSPHWLRGDVPATKALRLGWTSSGGTATAQLPAAVDLSHQRYLEARVIGDPAHPDSRLDLLLTDTSGRMSAVPAGAVSPLPGSTEVRKLWAQTVQVSLSSFTGVDRRHVRAVGMRASSRSGLVFVLDMFAASPGQVANTVSPRTVPRFDVASPSITLPADDQTHDVPVRVEVVGRVVVPAQLWVVVQGAGPSPGGNPVLTPLTVAPGAQSAVVHVQVQSSSVWSPYPDRIALAVYARRNAVIGNYVGGGDVQSDVPPPTLRALAPDEDVTQGDPIRWTLRLSAPTRYGYYQSLVAVAPSGTELTTGDLLRPWVAAHTSSAILPDGSPAPLSQAGIQVSAAFEALSTTYTVEIPTAATSTSTGDRTAALDIAPDGAVLTRPLRLTATVHARP